MTSKTRSVITLGFAALFSISASAGEITEWVKSPNNRGTVTGASGVASLAVGIGVGAHQFNQAAHADHASEASFRSAYEVERKATMKLRIQDHESDDLLQKKLQEAHAYLSTGTKGSLLSDEERHHLDGFAKAFRAEEAKALNLKAKSKSLAIKGASAMAAGMIAVEVVPPLTELMLSNESKTRQERISNLDQKAQACTPGSQLKREPAGVTRNDSAQ